MGQDYASDITIMNEEFLNFDFLNEVSIIYVYMFLYLIDFLHA